MIVLGEERYQKLIDLVFGLKRKVYELDKRVEELEKIQRNLRKTLEMRGFKLTEKQLKVLELISQGYTPKEIAKIMGASSEQTIYQIITRIREKGETVYRYPKEDIRVKFVEKMIEEAEEGLSEEENTSKN